MKSPKTSLLSFVSVFLFFALWAASAHTEEDFLHCLYSNNAVPNSKVVYTPNNSSFLRALDFSIQNLRFTSPTTPKPEVIVTPADESQVRAVIYCSKKHGLPIRVRGCGHDFEGLSYISPVPFVILDMINLRSITVDVQEGTAWVQGGANLGELYYSVGKASKTLGFPAGLWSTVGAGGHISGGGYGNLIRKYGVASDCIIDVRFMDVNGRILDRNSMSKDLFWAIKGGGGNSFGVILAYKLKLVPVPETVTAFMFPRTSEQNLTMLVHKWQYIAPKLHKDLTLRISIQPAYSSQKVQVLFFGTFLGGVDRLLRLMHQSFPELGLLRKECTEMSWLESVVYFAGHPGEPLEVLLNRTLPPKPYFKGKSDFVKEPISINGLEGIWKIFDKKEAQTASMELTPYGGRMEEISSSKTAFPHRAGNLYMILYLVEWDGSQATVVPQNYLDWIQGLYNYMTPYVSKSPRASFFPYRDLDLGANKMGSTSYEHASIWGLKYFKNNFKRLAQVKTMIDPDNFFHDEQSIPPLSAMVE